MFMKALVSRRSKKFAKSSIKLLKSANPLVAKLVLEELKNQRTTLKLIASENYSSIPVQAAMGTIFTDKYAEGFPEHRFYAGCEIVDKLEKACADSCASLFGADYAYVQPHSGADANLCAYWAILNAKVQTPLLEELGESNPVNLTEDTFLKVRQACHNQKLLALDYYSGGHLTHGYRHNISSQLFDVYTYSVDKDTYLLDYDKIQKQAEEIKPLVILTGYSAYSRKIDFSKMRKIADSVGAVLMVDMAHFAGLVAGGVFEGEFNPVKYADIVTSTTHKTLRGPRGGIVLCKEEFIPYVNKGCPLVIGGPLEHVIAAKLIAFEEAHKPSFKKYAKKIVENSQALAQALISNGINVLTGGTDNHIVLIDVSKFGINGRQAESALRSIGVTLNRNAIPYDKNGPWYTSGLRLGTAALTTRGMGCDDMKVIADIIYKVLSSTKPEEVVDKDGNKTLSRSKYVLDENIFRSTSAEVQKLLEKYPLYPEIKFN